MADDAESNSTKHVGDGHNGKCSINKSDFEILNKYSYLFISIINSRECFEFVIGLGNKIEGWPDFIRRQAYFSSGVMAYCRCYNTAATGVRTLDPKNVYAGSPDCLTLHKRLIYLRNNMIAHNNISNLLKLNLEVKEESSRILIKHNIEMSFPLDEIKKFIELVYITEEKIINLTNKHMLHVGSKIGKEVISG